ncbi:DgyrCDS12382 [Dimorphilus gyrociliatus]|uniref:DgyrCDS12382 n=1 Tax=Dimorphilus gyrociliatus TaxID=2664684 RepID=A0A7I8W7V1_9ANNE|nr:DgyrCDS12382 [Dimorphilus gyrociliatus]
MAHPSEPPPSYDDIFSSNRNPLRTEAESLPEDPPEYSETPQTGESRYFTPLALPSISSSIPLSTSNEPIQERPWYEISSFSRGVNINVHKLQKAAVIEIPPWRITIAILIHGVYYTILALAIRSALGGFGDSVASKAILFPALIVCHFLVVIEGIRSPTNRWLTAANVTPSLQTISDRLRGTKPKIYIKAQLYHYQGNKKIVTGQTGEYFSFDRWRDSSAAWTFSDGMVTRMKFLKKYVISNPDLKLRFQERCRILKENVAGRDEHVEIKDILLLDGFSPYVSAYVRAEAKPFCAGTCNPYQVLVGLTLTWIYRIWFHLGRKQVGKSYEIVKEIY